MITAEYLDNYGRLSNCSEFRDDKGEAFGLMARLGFQGYELDYGGHE